ncbi:MAG TPA: PrsW family glutamic-type intramembrane protease [Methanocorpusculum sp.]|nr:PrsW family glutamic-type intramembrane protease [Methanocorpusculum sp.]
MSVEINVIIGITIPLLLLFLVVDRKAKIPVGFLIVGFFACCIAAYLSAAIAAAYDYTSIELARYVAPVVEETIKVLPVMLFILLRKPDIRTAFMAAAAVGVGFATIENILYFMSFDVSNFGFVLIRGLSTGIMHVMTVLLVTLVLYQVMRVGALRYIVVLISVLAFATTFHGLYNLLVNSASVVAVTIGYIIPPVFAVIFLIYLLHTDIGKFFARLQNRQP